MTSDTSASADITTVRAMLADLSHNAETPAVGLLLRQAYELTLVAEQYIDPLSAPTIPEWYDAPTPTEGESRA